MILSNNESYWTVSSFNSNYITKCLSFYCQFSFFSFSRWIEIIINNEFLLLRSPLWLASLSILIIKSYHYDDSNEIILICGLAIGLLFVLENKLLAMITRKMNYFLIYIVAGVICCRDLLLVCVNNRNMFCRFCTSY